MINYKYNYNDYNYDYNSFTVEITNDINPSTYHKVNIADLIVIVIVVVILFATLQLQLQIYLTMGKSSISHHKFVFK